MCSTLKQVLQVQPPPSFQIIQSTAHILEMRKTPQGQERLQRARLLRNLGGVRDSV